MSLTTLHQENRGDPGRERHNQGIGDNKDHCPEIRRYGVQLAAWHPGQVMQDRHDNRYNSDYVLRDRDRNGHQLSI